MIKGMSLFMGTQVDERTDERLRLAFTRPDALDSIWENLKEQAEDFAQREGMPFEQALKALTRDFI